MARRLRLQYPGAIYHLMSRGHRQEPVFLEDADALCFSPPWGNTITDRSAGKARRTKRCTWWRCGIESGALEGI